MSNNWQGCHQPEEPFSLAWSAAHCRRLGSRAFSSVAVVSCCLRRSARKVALASRCCSLASPRSADWSGAERRNELSYSLVRVVGLLLLLLLLLYTQIMEGVVR